MAWSLRCYLASLLDARSVLTAGPGLGVYCGSHGMTGWGVGPAGGLGLADAIGVLRDELLEAQAAGAGSGIQLPVESMTVVLKVTATRLVDGKAGFKVPIVDLELPKPHPNEFSVRAARRSRLWRRSWVGLRRLQCSCSRVRGDACSLGQGSRESEAGQDAVVEAGHGADPAARKGED
jgi:hypothetical protein